VWKQWTELNMFLMSVLQTLVAKIRLLPLDVTLEPVPSSIPYTGEHLEECAACGCAYRALRCFQHLFTMCLWAMVYFPPLDQPETGWSHLLLDKGFSPTMVQMLRDLPISQFSPSPPRLGVVMPVWNFNAVITVPHMARAHVPVWVWWGLCDTKAQRTFSRLKDNTAGSQFLNDHFYPSNSDLADAVRKSLRQMAQPSAFVPTTTPLVDFPKLHHGSGQCPGETWQQFFAHQEQCHAQMLNDESPAD